MTANFRAMAGEADHQLCICSKVSRASDEFVVTRAQCCVGDYQKAARGLFTCPPHLPYVSRYRSSRNNIRQIV